VEPLPDFAPVSAEAAVACAVAAFGAVRAPADTIPTLRQTLGRPGHEPFPPAFLKHADEQTVVGLAAVFQAIDRHGWTRKDFADWGVLGAPRFLGRACLAVALQRFALEGAWGVSPHLIPHRSLHSISGTISQGLGIHGPNFGAGGGPHGAGEVLLTAAALVADRQLPGLWVVLTGCDPEPVLDHPGRAAAQGPALADAVYGAAALAVTDCSPGWEGPRLHVKARVAGKRFAKHANGSASPELPRLSLEALLDVLASEQPGAAWGLGCGGAVKLERLRGGAEGTLSSLRSCAERVRR
jgi:hypothetical protein